jgi:hypothetical protein
MIVRIHNTKTGGRFEFRCATQAEADAKLERKAQIYGSPADRVVEIDTATEAAEAAAAQDRQDALRDLRDANPAAVADPEARKILRALRRLALER